VVQKDRVSNKDSLSVKYTYSRPLGLDVHQSNVTRDSSIVQVSGTIKDPLTTFTGATYEVNLFAPPANNMMTIDMGGTCKNNVSQLSEDQSSILSAGYIAETRLRRGLQLRLQ
jgi:hypothetical protein